eukprot:4934497-Pyramimonas_sp.AAC.2
MSSVEVRIDTVMISRPISNCIRRRNPATALGSAHRSTTDGADAVSHEGGAPTEDGEELMHIHSDHEEGRAEDGVPAVLEGVRQYDGHGDVSEQHPEEHA